MVLVVVDFGEGFDDTIENSDFELFVLSAKGGRNILDVR